MTDADDHARVVNPFLTFGGVPVAGLLLQGIDPVSLLLVGTSRIAGGVIVAPSLILGGLSTAAMRRARTSPNPNRPTIVIVDSGPFRFSRNPIYLSLLATYAAVAAFANSLWASLLPVAFWMINRRVVDREEIYQGHKFGEAYRLYKTRVRRWI